MIVRHNTELLEKAIEHVVRRASIPSLRAEAEARRTSARAVGFRRLATGAAIALAAVGIGLGIFFGTQPKSPHTEVTSTEDGKQPASPKTPDHIPAPAPSQPMPNPGPPGKPEEHAPITTKYTLFNEEDVTLHGKPWRLEAGHYYTDATQTAWQHAWCYTRVLVGGVEIQVELVNRDSPDAIPTAPIASVKTLAAAGLDDTTALELGSQCPWRDGKRFSPTEFQYPIGRDKTPPSPPAVFNQVGAILNYDGAIDDQFIGVIKEHSFDTLVINSLGGLLYRGLEGGKWLRENKKIVRVEKECSSACVYVLAGGVSRVATDQAKIGVHRFYDKSATDPNTALQAAQISDADIVSFFQSMGIKTELFVAMQKVPSEDMQYVPHDKLLEWKLLTPEAAQPDSYGFVRVTGQDALGDDLSKNGVRVKDLDACAQSCKENSECAAFTLDTLNNFCFLKDKLDIVVFDPRAVMGYKKVDGFTPKSPISVMLRSKTKLLGKSYKSQPDLASGECELLCLKEDRCRGYNYETTRNPFTSQKICSLLNTIEGTSGDDNVSSGQRSSGVDVVSAFYASLTHGDGQAAQGFLVPEKRGHGNFDPAAMTRFYGSFTEPLSVRAETQTSLNEVRVEYHYAGSAGACDGSANVTLRQIGSDLLIDSIQSQGC